MNKAEWMSGKYGIMVHFLSHIASTEGKKKLSPNEMADNFDVKGFVDKAQKMGASWIIFPIGQNTGYYWSENPNIEKWMPGRCTKRDLILEIAKEVKKRGMHFIAYLPSEMDSQKEDIRKAFSWDESSDKKEFMKKYTPVVRYYAEKFGKNLDGWWFDGNYDASQKSFLRTHDWTNDRFDKKEWFGAAKAGNPDAAVAMCTGCDAMGCVFEEEEYLPGEANGLTHLPWDYASRDKQWHVLTFLDCFWFLQENEQMPDPRYTNKELYRYVKSCTDKKGAVTLNIGIFEDGTLAKKSVNQVMGLRKYLKINDFTLMNNKYDDGIKKFGIHMKNMNNCEPFELACSLDGDFYQHKGEKLGFMFNWMTSFVTGLAPLYFQNTKNENYIKWANQFEKYYHSKVFETPLESMHDLGFLYSPYSVMMYKLTGDISHRNDALKAADELAKRFDIKGGYIDAWGRMDDDERVGRAIIDCMMNIALLLWAWKETKHTYYRDIAKSHAEVTRKYFIRDDFSVAHSFDFDRETGKCICEHNGCGYSDGSWWARGTAWAVYGFAILGKYFDSDEYRELALNIFNAYKKHLPEDSFVPVWDFSLPADLPAKMNSLKKAEWDESKKENCKFNVDTSATAIVACGLLCLYDQTGDDDLLDFAIKSIEELGNNHINYDPKFSGLLKHQNGNMTYTTYGDYFFIEAVSNILFNTEICW